ncbi:hypothetical protein GCM10027035_18560 [Emticicia sediminis]
MKQQKFIYRLAELEEISTILNIWEINIRHDYAVTEQTISECKKVLTQLFENRNGTNNFWVSVDNKTKEVIGWQSFLPIFHTPLKKETAVESSTYILPNYHKSGVAYELMKYALSQLPTSKVHFVYGFVNKENKGAIKLVNKIGFREVGIIPAFPSVFPYIQEKILFIYIIK